MVGNNKQGDEPAQIVDPGDAGRLLHSVGLFPGTIEAGRCYKTIRNPQPIRKGPSLSTNTPTYPQPPPGRNSSTWPQMALPAPFRKKICPIEKSFYFCVEQNC